jgi:hypothetical protein
MSGPEVEYVQAKGRTCPEQTALAVPRRYENCPKTRHSTDFGIGPIEYIYIHVCVCVCVCVCVVHGQVMKIKTYIWLEFK